MKTLWRRHDQTGGAISLWVVLMAPVTAFAAVVAMAGPQRLAAESSMEETAGDLAAFSVVLRDGRSGQLEGEIEGFLPDCEALPTAVPTGADPTRWGDQRDDLLEACLLLVGDGTGTAAAYWHRDLGGLGVDAGSWQGFYSDSVVPDPACVISGNLETRRAVYAALAADWQDAGWAAAQVWPDGVRLGSESVARLNHNSSSTSIVCDLAAFAPPPDSDPPRTVFAN